jgi:hypothetical protein
VHGTRRQRGLLAGPGVHSLDSDQNIPHSVVVPERYPLAFVSEIQMAVVRKTVAGSRAVYAGLAALAGLRLLR